MKTVNVAILKNRLSAYLQEVRAGEEIVIRDRNLPVAKLTLVASGELQLPSEKLNERAFWSIGTDNPVTGDAMAAALRAISEDREERDAGLLGR